MDLALIIYNGLCAIKPNRTKTKQTNPEISAIKKKKIKQIKCLVIINICGFNIYI